MHPTVAARLRALMVVDDLETALSRSVLVLARALAERNHDVAVVSLSPSPAGFDQDARGVRVFPPPDNRADLDGNAARRAWLRTITGGFDPHVVHAHGIAATAVASAAATPDGVPLLATLPSPAPVGIGAAAASPSGHALIAPTPHAAAQLRSAMGYGADRVQVIPPAVSLDACDGDGRRLPRVRRLIGAVSDLVPEARMDVFLRAVARIRAALPEATYVVVGDGPERPALEELAERLDIREQVGFLHDRSDMSGILRRLDVLCLPGASAAAPYAALEAMALGVPIVAAGCGDVEHMARPRREALVVPQEDEEALAAAARCVLEHRLLAWRLGWAARRRVRRRFSVSRIVRLHEELYDACRRTERMTTPAPEPLPLAVSA